MVLNPLHNPLPENKGRLWELIIPRKLFIRCMVARQRGLLGQHCRCGPFGLCLLSVDRWWTGETKWCKMGWIKIKMNTIALFINVSSLPGFAPRESLRMWERKSAEAVRLCKQDWSCLGGRADCHWYTRKLCASVPRLTTRRIQNVRAILKYFCYVIGSTAEAWSHCNSRSYSDMLRVWFSCSPSASSECRVQMVLQLKVYTKDEQR
jgi:hypothetical protein